MTKIVAFAGKAISGKNSSANLITGHIIKQLGMVESYDINNEGKLVVPSLMEDGSIEQRILDLEDYRPEVQSFLAETIHPAVKTYSFASPLKNMAINLFGLSYSQCHGTDEEKNTPTTVMQKDIPGYKKQGMNSMNYLTGREFLQIFGTEVCRRIKDNCWTQYCLNNIKAEEPQIALITDMRFLNEAQAVKEAGGTIIYLTRDTTKYHGNHKSETEPLQIQEIADFVCDNQNMTIQEKNKQIIGKLVELGVITE
jgi:hypothetical protein